MPDGGADLREELTPVGPQYRVTLSFRDAAEIRWQVDEDGNLTRPASCVTTTTEPGASHT